MFRTTATGVVEHHLEYTAGHTVQTIVLYVPDLTADCKLFNEPPAFHQRTPTSRHVASTKRADMPLTVHLPQVQIVKHTEDR